VSVDFDVGILGGGPAGSAMAAYLARAGVTCVVFESEHFPRPHVGESLVPASTRVLGELGFLPEMDRLGFVRKYGALWSSSAKTRPYQHDWHGVDADCNVAIRFDERDQPGVAQPYTWHVDRGKFDLALLEHAERAGATVRQGTRVARVDFDPREPEIELAGGERVRVRMVADASGRKTLLGRQLGLKVHDASFDQYAIHSWFAGYARHTLAKPDDIHVHFLPMAATWVWQIPITADVTSIGVVTQKRLFKAARQSPEQFFQACLAGRPELAELLRRAERIRPFTEEADYSYAMRQFAGDRFVLLGDAARFVDPIFSSGVSIAMNSARLSSRDAIAGLEAGDVSRAAFDRFETMQRRGVKNWYDFICCYYRLNVLFTHFVAQPSTRLDVLKLLQGDVYDDETPAAVQAMRDKIAEVQGNPAHMWHPLLTELTAGVLASAHELAR
jgi:1H-pyrrole-2-carbonyl-[peptidyl-carrier protein] chlorinase